MQHFPYRPAYPVPSSLYTRTKNMNALCRRGRLLQNRNHVQSVKFTSITSVSCHAIAIHSPVENFSRQHNYRTGYKRPVVSPFLGRETRLLRGRARKIISVSKAIPLWSVFLTSKYHSAKTSTRIFLEDTELILSTRKNQFSFSWRFLYNEFKRR